ncbi:hypothetical protein AVEN_188825-1 [Araneus ventricosus]|uniref:Uncharacterized protein n=1 Tax=Araneus ventricosus TaxID=182803 RepID=A0A4Y2BVE0_ARAVE|nr:hypothetical protein AVEN_188825-1 [Araneus ventricosus]
MKQTFKYSTLNRSLSHLHKKAVPMTAGRAANENLLPTPRRWHLKHYVTLTGSRMAIPSIVIDTQMEKFRFNHFQVGNGTLKLCILDYSDVLGHPTNGINFQPVGDSFVGGRKV